MAALYRCLIVVHAFTLCFAGQSLSGGAGCTRVRGELTCSVAGALASASVGHSQMQSLSARRSHQTITEDDTNDVLERRDIVVSEDVVLEDVTGNISQHEAIDTSDAIGQSAGVPPDGTIAGKNRSHFYADFFFINSSNATTLQGKTTSVTVGSPHSSPSAASNVTLESVERAEGAPNSTPSNIGKGPQLSSSASSTVALAPDEGTEAKANDTSSDVPTVPQTSPSASTGVASVYLSSEEAERSTFSWLIESWMLFFPSARINATFASAKVAKADRSTNMVLLESPVEGGFGIDAKAWQPLDLSGAQGIHLLIGISLLTCLLFVTVCIVEKGGFVRKTRSTLTSPPLLDAPDIDAMTYEMAGMATWDVFTVYAVTIVGRSRSLWRRAWLMLLMITGVAICEALIESDASTWTSLLFSDVAFMLHLFGVFLLTVFLASSVRRWYSCVGGLLDLMNVIRGMQLELHALGADQERCDLVCRYGVLSVWGLVYEMRRQALHGESTAEESEALRRMLAELESRPSVLSRLLPDERRLLEGMDNFPGLMWVWVGSLLGRMAQDGEIPHMGSDAYGRLVGLVQEAQAGMLLVRDSGTMQTHHAVYMHAVSVVVHLNNALSAVSLGLALGACAGSAVSRAGQQLEAPVAFVMLLRCLLLPLAFLVSLEVGVSLNQPFTSESGSIPVERFLRRLEGDLQDCSRLVAEPPSWRRPQFQGTWVADEELAVEPLAESDAAGLL